MAEFCSTSPFLPRLRAGTRTQPVNEDVYSHAEQAVLQYQGLGLLATTYENMAEPQKAKTCKDRVTALRVKEGSRLWAYLADPHLDFSKWPDFKAAR